MRLPPPIRPPLGIATVLPLALGLLLLTGCDEAVLQPTQRGTVDGRVLAYDTGAPLSGANVTTSPATGAFVTDGEGTFTLRNIEEGTYQIAVRKAGYRPNTISVAVREDETTPATLFLERDEAATRTDSLTAEIVNWRNRTLNADTTFVDVEYRVQNVGSAPIATYEVYVRITTDGDPFYQEVRGDSLQPRQADIATFSKFIRDRAAQAVTVEDLYVEPSGS